MNQKTRKKPAELMPAQKQEISVETAESIGAMSPIQQMVQAKSMGLSVEEMKDMLMVQKEWEANEARKAFHVALADFKKHPPQIVKDKINGKYGSSYVSIGNMVNTVNEAMGPHGLSARWEFPADQPGVISCTCILSHTLGHEEKVTLQGAPDKAGSKNPLQENKSTRTYLKLETFEAVTGMASVEGNLDDDGNAAGQAAPEVVRISEEQALTLDAKITDNDLDTAVFTSWISKFFPYTQGNIDLLMAEHYAKVLAKLDETIKHKAAAAE